jgi:ribosomal protein S18 acetylase RimI-like enzyme
MLPQGYSFGAYHARRLIGFAIGEAFPGDQLLRVWEFHVMDGFRRMGVVRALIEQEISIARLDGLTTVMLETQNTNVKAIRFYRSMGFSLESIDLSPMHYGEGVPSQVAFYMKRRL